MARKYASHPAAHPVKDEQLEEARKRVREAEERLRDAQSDDPLDPSWTARYEHAQQVHNIMAARLAALQAVRAAQVERQGKRAETVAKNQDTFKDISASLTATRDAIAAAAVKHMQATAELVQATEAHNQNLKDQHDRMAELGLRIRDDLLEGQPDHPEGCHDNLSGQGITLLGTTWMPVPAGGVVTHALVGVFAVTRGQHHEFAGLGYRYPAHQVTSRVDGLVLPEVPAGLKTPPLVPSAEFPRDIVRPQVIREDKRRYIPADGKTPARV